MWICSFPIAPVSAGRRVQGQKISWWEGQKGLAFLQDVELVDGELVVPQPGLYYVYAQTYFRHTHSLEEEGEDGEEAEDRGRPLLQYVYKKVRVAIMQLWFQDVGCCSTEHLQTQWLTAERQRRTVVSCESDSSNAVTNVSPDSEFVSHHNKADIQL